MKSAYKVNPPILKTAIPKILLSLSTQPFNKYLTSTCGILGTELNIRDTAIHSVTQILAACFRKPEILSLGSLILVEEV